MKSVTTMLIALSGFVAGCGRDGPPASSDNLRIEAHALSLTGVGDVAYTIEVRTAGDEIVWREEHLHAKQYGNGRDLTYVGPCDASVGANPHAVTLIIEDLFEVGGGTIARGSWQNPTPVTVSAVCRPNADTLVAIDLTIMRDAGQGFFDIAVEFDNVFCSAKLDCKDEGLLFDPETGKRVPTAVLGFACSGGTPDTRLWLDDVVLTCGATSTALEIGGPAGNQYDLARAPPAPLVQVATYYGAESLSYQGQPLGKLYFNVALGVDLDAVMSDCTLSATGSASKADFAVPFTTPANTTWPLVRWNVDLVSATTHAYACAAQALNDPEAPPGKGVFTEYATAPHRFDYVLSKDPSDATLAVLRHREGDGSEPSTLDVFLYGDADRDGAFDVGEEPVEAATVTLTGATTATFVSGGNGHAAGPLAAGTWAVSVDVGQAALEGFLASSPTLPTNVVVAPIGVTRLSLGFVEAAEVRGYVFVAATDDALFDGDEAVLPGLELRMVSGSGVVSATSDDDGAFDFVVLPGTWTLEPTPDQAALAPYAAFTPTTLTLGAGEFVALDLGLTEL